MNKKFKFSDQPKKVKILYAAVIGVLCVTAVVIGIMSAASKENTLPDDSPSANLPIVGGDEEVNKDENKNEENDNKNEEAKPEKLTFASPVVGSVTKGHSLEVPVFSDTLGEWRVHTGIDISAEEGSKVYAAASGVVSRVYNDPLLGKTVEISHEGGIVSVYSNLDNNGIEVKEGDSVRGGTLIGLVGDTSLSELADEGHLHFAIKIGGVSVNPLDYISEDSKRASLNL